MQFVRCLLVYVNRIFQKKIRNYNFHKFVVEFVGDHRSIDCWRLLAIVDDCCCRLQALERGSIKAVSGSGQIQGFQLYFSLSFSLFSIFSVFSLFWYWFWPELVFFSFLENFSARFAISLSSTFVSATISIKVEKLEKKSEFKLKNLLLFPFPPPPQQICYHFRII